MITKSLFLSVFGKKKTLRNGKVNVSLCHHFVMPFGILSS